MLATWLPTNPVAPVTKTFTQSKGTAKAVPNLIQFYLEQLFEGFGLNADILFAGAALFPVLPHPSFPTLACGGIATAKSQAGYVGIRDAPLFIRACGKNAHHRIMQRFSAAAIENVTFDLASIL